MRRSPKCHALGPAVNEAKSTAVATKIALWMSVATMVKVGSSSADPSAPIVNTDTIPTAMSVALSATRKPTAAYHGGQRGAAPSGSSGGSGGRWLTATCHRALRLGRRAPRASARVGIPAGADPSAVHEHGAHARRACAGHVVLRESPTWSASSGSAPASSRARLNGAGSGLAAPTTAEDTTPSTRSSRPGGRSHSGSEQSQLLTTISA